MADGCLQERLGTSSEICWGCFTFGFWCTAFQGEVDAEAVGGRAAISPIPSEELVLEMNFFVDKGKQTTILCNPPSLLTEEIPPGPLTESGSSAALPCV